LLTTESAESKQPAFQVTGIQGIPCYVFSAVHADMAGKFRMRKQIAYLEAF
jgi:hypothetical protein